MSDNRPNLHQLGMPLPYDHALHMLGRLRARLRARWVLRVAVAAIVAACMWFAVSSAVLLLVWVDYPTVMASILGAAAVFAIGAYARRQPPPDWREAALYAEAHGIESGAVELLVDHRGTPAPSGDGELARQSAAIPEAALVTLQSCERRPLPAAISIRMALSLTLALISAAAMAVAWSSSVVPAEVSAGDSRSRTTGGAGDAVLPPPAASVLAALRDALLAATPEQRAEAARRYSESWGERQKAAQSLASAAEHGEAAATSDDARRIAAAASEQREAVADAKASGVTGLEDAMRPSAAVSASALAAQSHQLAVHARRIGADADEARRAAMRGMLDPERVLRELAAARAGTGGREAGSLSDAVGGTVTISADAWQIPRATDMAAAGTTQYSPALASVMARYTAALETEK